MKSTHNSVTESLSAELELRREWVRLNEEREKLEQMVPEIEAARTNGPPVGNAKGKNRGKTTTNQQWNTDDRCQRGN